MHVLATEVVHRVNCYIDEHHTQFTSLGEPFFKTFGSNNGKVSAQVRNLQQITCSATRFADIEDFVRNQMGKGDNKWQAVGERVLRQLAELRSDSCGFADDPSHQMAVRLRLARGWGRAVVGEYLYRLALHQMEDGV